MSDRCAADDLEDGFSSIPSETLFEGVDGSARPPGEEEGPVCSPEAKAAQIADDKAYYARLERTYGLRVEFTNGDGAQHGIEDDASVLINAREAMLCKDIKTREEFEAQFPECAAELKRRSVWEQLESALEKALRTRKKDDVVALVKIGMGKEGIETESAFFLKKGIIYGIVRDRRLLEKIGFRQETEEDWRRLKPAEMVAYAMEKIVQEDMMGREELRLFNELFYNVLLRRELLKRLPLEYRFGRWALLDKEGRLKAAKALKKAEHLKTGWDFRKAGARVLLEWLEKDGTLGQLKLKEPYWGSFGKEGAIAKIREKAERKGIITKTGLSLEMWGAFKFLRDNGWLAEAGFGSKGVGKPSLKKMEEGRFVKHVQGIIDAKGLTGMHRLADANGAVCKEVRRRKVKHLLRFAPLARLVSRDAMAQDENRIAGRQKIAATGTYG